MCKYFVCIVYMYCIYCVFARHSGAPNFGAKVAVKNVHVQLVKVCSTDENMGFVRIKQQQQQQLLEVHKRLIPSGTSTAWTEYSYSSLRNL